VFPPCCYIQLLEGGEEEEELVFDPPSVPYDYDYLFDAAGDNVIIGASAVTTVSDQSTTSFYCTGYSLAG
jgi:hypothetical protein